MWQGVTWGKCNGLKLLEGRTMLQEIMRWKHDMVPGKCNGLELLEKRAM